MTEEQILAEAKAEREKELVLAKVHESGLTERKRLEIQDRQERRPYKMGAFAILCVLLLVTVISYFVWRDGEGKRNQHDRDIRQQQETAQECIRAGNIWADGNCLITRK